MFIRAIDDRYVNSEHIKYAKVMTHNGEEVKEACACVFTVDDDMFVIGKCRDKDLSTARNNMQAFLDNFLRDLR